MDTHKIVRLFIARYTVKWQKPLITTELDIYFNRPEIGNLLAKNSLIFDSDFELNRFLSLGPMTTLSSEVISQIKCLSSDMQNQLNNQTFSQAYKELENKIEQGDLTLEAPIVIQFKNGSYCCYSGRKRACVALTHDVPLTVFLVKQED